MTSEEEELFASLEETFNEVLQEGIEDLTKMNTSDLLNLLYDTDDELKSRNELYADNGSMFGASTAEGRDLHARRAACIVELRRRGVG